MSIDIISAVIKNCDELCHKTAIKFENTEISYSDLKVGIFKYIEILQENGLKQGDSLTLYCHKSPDLIYTIFASLILNIRFLLLNENITKSLKEKVDLLSFKVLDLKVLSQTKFLESNVNIFEVEWRADNKESHYCLTSGSTGTSKLAVNSRWGLANTISYGMTCLDINQQTIFYQNASVLFDIFLWESLTPLVAGGTLIIESNENSWNIHKAVEVIYKEKITHLQLTPSLIYYFIKLVDPSKTSLKYLLSTGEVMTLDLASSVLNKLPLINFVNHYGPCECAIYIMSHSVKKHDLQMPGIPLGCAIPNVNLVYKSTNEDNVYEILVKNPELNLGYLSQETHQYDHYSTGDLIREHNEHFYFIGRNDFQTKINGIRFNLIEIEEILSSLFMQTVICIKINSSTIVAFHEIDFNFSNEMQVKLKEELLPPLHPKRIIKIASFPRLETGKINRNQLEKEYDRYQ